MKFEAIDVCVKCEHLITGGEKYYSNGCCPYCGNVNESTLVDVRKIVRPAPESAPLLAATYWQKIKAIFA